MQIKMGKIHTFSRRRLRIRRRERRRKSIHRRSMLSRRVRNSPTHQSIRFIVGDIPEDIRRESGRAEEDSEDNVQSNQTVDEKHGHGNATVEKKWVYDC